MNGNGEAWDRPVDQGQAAELVARVTATADRATAVVGRADTTDAFLCPPIVTRDPELVQIHAEAGRFFQACLTGSWVPGYLASRSLDAALLPTSPWKIGYAPLSWTALTDHLRRLGHSDAALLCSGLVANGKNGQLRDRFHDRLMIPLRAEDGIVVAFIGRRHPDAGDDHGPKYLNSPDTDLFTKGHILAGLAEGRNAIRAGAQPVLVEGPLDAIAVSIAAPGRFIGVAPCGTALTGHQVAALARAVDLGERGLRVAFDGDPAGRRATVRAHATLSPVISGVTAITFPGNADPASTLTKDGRQALADVLTKSTRPLADLVVDARIEDRAHGRELTFPELQIGALRAAAQAIATMHADEVGPQAVRLCATFAGRYGWKPDEVTREVIDAIERHYQGDPLACPLSGRGYHPADSPWAVVLRATAPPRLRLAATRRGDVTSSRIIGPNQPGRMTRTTQRG